MRLLFWQDVTNCIVESLYRLFCAEISEQHKKLQIMKKEFADQEKSYNDWRRKHLAQAQRARVEERKAAEEAHQLELLVFY
jgi:DNA gyrase/topoisomerase IV subunit A